MIEKKIDNYLNEIKYKRDEGTYYSFTVDIELTCSVQPIPIKIELETDIVEDGDVVNFGKFQIKGYEKATFRRDRFKMVMYSDGVSEQDVREDIYNQLSKKSNWQMIVTSADKYDSLVDDSFKVKILDQKFKNILNIKPTGRL